MADYQPIPEWDDDYDVPDDNRYDDADETGAFGPLSSTPAPGTEFQTEQEEKSGLPEPPDLRELPGLSTTTFSAPLN